MDVLTALEQKIGSLLELVKHLTERTKKLELENEKLLAEQLNLTNLNAQLTQESTELRAQLEKIEFSALKGNSQIEELNQEKALTKLVLDDLIQSIDSLVEREN